MNEQNHVTTAQLMDEAILEKFFLFHGVRPRSAASYKYNLKLFFNYLIGREIVHPERKDVFAYKTSLINSGKKPSTVHTYIIAVRVFFHWTAQEGIYHNIADHVKVPHYEHGHRRDALTVRQVRALLNKVDRSTLKGLRDYALLMVMVVGGLRCIEVSRAKVGDFARRGNDTVLYVWGKGRDDSRSEFVKLSGSVKRAIRAYLKRRGKAEPDAPLFASVGNSNRGSPISTRLISKIVKDTLLEAGYDSDRLCAHSLRHTAVTLALRGGEKLEAVKEFARHTNINTTLVYSHALDRERCTCSRTIEEAIFGQKQRRKPAALRTN